MAITRFAAARNNHRTTLIPFPDQGDGSTLSLDFTTMSGLDSRFTFTRSSTATFINSAGLVQYADHNLATNTVFANTGTDVPTSWTRPSGTGTSGSNGTFVDGNEEWTQTAALTERPYLSQGITIAIGLTYTCSVYVASAPSGIEARNIIWPVITAGSSQYYQDGVAITSTTVITPGRISVVVTPTSGSSVNFRVGLGCTNGNADTVGTAVFSRPMLVVGDAVSKPYLASNPGPYQAPRFDHDPSTLAPRGLLLESSTTNLLEYSETFDSPWILTDLQRSTTESTTAPDGTTVYAIETTSGTSSRNFLRTAGAVTGTSVTFSYWFKPGNVTNAETSATNQSAGRIFGIYKTNVTAGMIYSIRIDGQDPTAFDVQVGTGTYEAVPYPNGWYRCRLTTTITTGDSIRVYLGSTGGTAVDSLYWYVWGAQLEAGSGASSYIPTGAGTVQRAADVCQFPFDPATYGYGTAPNHTFAMGWNIGVGATSGFPGMFEIRDVGGNRCHGFTINSAANPTHFSGIGFTAGNVATVGITNRPIGVNRKLASSVIDGATGHNFSIDGVAGTPQAVTSAVLRVPNRLGSPGVQIPSATVQFVKFYPFAMTSAQLDAITS